MKIVCFGDSLTVGFQSPTQEAPYYHETPYGDMLQRCFGKRATVLTRGHNGELTGEMTTRFPRDVLREVPHSVIILGGTNDLGMNMAPSTIFENLTWMYDQASQSDIQPVAVTVPSLRDVGDQQNPEFQKQYINPRVELNRLIMTHCQAQSLACIDLYSATLEPGGTLLLAPQYSNDGIHLSTKGYECFAGLVWDQVWAREYGIRSTVLE